MKASLSLWPKPFAKLASGLVFLTGTTVLLGWATDTASLKSVLSGLPKMAALTAFLMVLMGVALWSASGEASSPLLSRQHGINGAFALRLSQFCAGIAMLVGLARLGAYLLRWDFPLDQLGFRELTIPSPPGRMAPATALDFLLLGTGLLLASTKRFTSSFQAIVLLGGLLGWLGFSHYLFGGQPLLPYSQMSVHTALAFLFLSAGILAIRSDLGLLALLLSDSPGGLIARRLVPAALLVPLAAGWLRLQAQRAGWFGTEAGIALFALTNIVVFGGLIWANAALLHRSDSERKSAEIRVSAQLERLSLLQQITRAIAERQDLASVYQVALRSLEEPLAFDFCCICDYDPAHHLLTVLHIGVASQSLALELALTEQARFRIDQNGLSRCVGGQLVYEPDISSAKTPFPQRLAEAGLRAFVAAPLRVESKVFGVFVAARREPHSFTSGECEFLRQLTEHVALAAHQAQLYAALQEAYDDLRKTQQAVMQQERLRALGQMAGGIAHDINNAISPISMYADLLLEKEPNLSENGRKYLETIQRAVNDAAHTVGRLREFYRQREPQLAVAPMDMNSLVKHVLDMTRARWSDIPLKHGVVIRLQLELVTNLPAVMGVESEIREALVNLVFNAVDAMPSGGTLTLRTIVVKRSSNKYATPDLPDIHLEVSDTGEGMDEDTRAHCKEPFFTTKGERGTGLGLAMVHGVARRHDADMEIDSAVGKGTTVRLIFAVAPTAAVGQPELPRATPPRSRILIVDDDPLVVRSLRETLEADGHLVFAATGGEMGIDAFHTAQECHEPFAVVITDLGMPNVDGHKVASAVKAASPSTPVILLTGWGQRLLADNDLSPHVDLVLNKPPKLRELRQALAQCLSSPALPELQTAGGRPALRSGNT